MASVISKSLSLVFLKVFRGFLAIKFDCVPFCCLDLLCILFSTGENWFLSGLAGMAENALPLKP